MDIYFTEDYGKLYEEHENAKVHRIQFESEHGKVSYVFLIREIPYEVDGKTYYDIITPYGFGGPKIIETTDAGRLMDDFYTHFHEYCVENRIVSEFVRFHPLENLQERHTFNGEAVSVGRQVIRDLKQPITKNMSKSLRKNYHVALENGVTVQFDSDGKRLNKFLELYYETMDRNQAESYYYFPTSFFEQMFRSLKDHFLFTHVYFKGEMIASGLALYGRDYSYGFLGGTTEAGYRHNANACLEIETMKWMKEKGLSYYIMGGGYDGEDGIYNFKKQFAKDSDYEYHIGKKVHQKDIYERLVEQHEKETNILEETFFPAYRAPIKKDNLITQST